MVLETFIQCVSFISHVFSIFLPAVVPLCVPFLFVPFLLTVHWIKFELPIYSLARGHLPESVVCLPEATPLRKTDSFPEVINCQPLLSWGWGLVSPSLLDADCWLACSPVGLLYLTGVVVSLWVKCSPHHTQKTFGSYPPWHPAFAVFLPHLPHWSLSLGGGLWYSCGKLTDTFPRAVLTMWV